MNTSDLKTKIQVITAIKNSFRQSPKKGYTDAQRVIRSSELKNFDKEKFLQSSEAVYEARRKLNGNRLLGKTAPKALSERVRNFLIEEYATDIGKRELKISIFPDIPLRLAVFLPYENLRKFTSGTARAPRISDYVFICEEGVDITGMSTDLSTLHELSHVFSNCLHPELLKEITMKKQGLEELKAVLQKSGRLYFREIQTEVVACMWNLSMFKDPNADSMDFIKQSTERFQAFFDEICHNKQLKALISTLPDAEEFMRNWKLSCNRQTSRLRSVAYRAACKMKGDDKESIWRSHILLSALDQGDLEEDNIETIIGLL